MPSSNKRSPAFTVVFVLTLLLISAAVFVVFTHFQRTLAEERRTRSAQNLETLRDVIRAYAAGHNGALPARAAEIATRVKSPEDLLHPAWPNQPGYVYIPGAQPSDGDDSILIYENAPESKRKLGFQVLLVNGKIEALSRDAFLDVLSSQEEFWKQKGRFWSPEELIPSNMGL